MLSPDYARLEVSILGSEPTASEEAGTESAASPGVRTALVLAAEEEVRSYIRSCLYGVPDLHIVEAVSWRDWQEVRPSSPPHLLVVDAPDAASAMDLIAGIIAGQTLDGVPRALILDERSTHIAEPKSDTPTVVLFKPFNAQRIVSAAKLLLASTWG